MASRTNRKLAAAPTATLVDAPADPLETPPVLDAPLDHSEFYRRLDAGRRRKGVSPLWIAGPVAFLVIGGGMLMTSKGLHDVEKPPTQVAANATGPVIPAAAPTPAEPVTPARTELAQAVAETGPITKSPAARTTPSATPPARTTRAATPSPDARSAASAATDTSARVRAAPSVTPPPAVTLTPPQVSPEPTQGSPTVAPSEPSAAPLPNDPTNRAPLADPTPAPSAPPTNSDAAAPVG